MTGALPPSSSDSRVTVRDAPSISSLPTRTLPVKLILRSAGWSSISWPIDSGSPLTRFSTPAGIPASTSSAVMSIAVSGVNSDARATTVQPAASAAAHARAGL